MLVASEVDVKQGPTASAGPPIREHYRYFALAALTIVLLALCIYLAVPFIPAITWGVALAIIAWPLHRWIATHITWPVAAAVLSSLVVVLLIVAPSVFVSYQLAREAAAIADRVQSEPNGASVRDKLAETRGLDAVIQWLDRLDIQIEAEARKVVAMYTKDAASLAQGSFDASIQFLVAIFILFHLFRSRGLFIRELRDLLPLTRAESDDVFARAEDSVHANLYATIITSLIDSTGGGLMFWWLGLPAPLLWGVIMFVLSILPIVGAALVWFPAAVYLALSGQWLGGLALLAWGVISFIIVDNIIYVRLAGQRMRMHEVPAMIAFLGGIAVFGLSGMILGPAIIAVTSAFLAVWRRRMIGGADPSAIAPPERVVVTS